MFNYILKYHPNKMKIRDVGGVDLINIPNYTNYTSVSELLNDFKDKYDYITIHDHMNFKLS